MRDNKERQDQELAVFTDALLKDQPDETSDRPPLADTVELLGRTLNLQSPPATLCRKIRLQIATEWVQPPPTLLQRLTQISRRPAYRWVWAPVAALVLIAIAIALFVPTDSTNTVGTVIGSTETIALTIGLTVVVSMVTAWLILRRRK